MRGGDWSIRAPAHQDRREAREAREAGRTEIGRLAVLVAFRARLLGARGLLAVQLELLDLPRIARLERGGLATIGLGERLPVAALLIVLGRHERKRSARPRCPPLARCGSTANVPAPSAGGLVTRVRACVGLPNRSAPRTPPAHTTRAYPARLQPAQPHGCQHLLRLAAWLPSWPHPYPRESTDRDAYYVGHRRFRRGRVVDADPGSSRCASSPPSGFGKVCPTRCTTQPAPCARALPLAHPRSSLARTSLPRPALAWLATPRHGPAR